MKSKTGRLLWAVLFSFSLIAFPAYSFAAEWSVNSTVPAGEVKDQTVFMSGDDVIVDGTVKGDLFAAGQRVIVNGVVEGDVFAAASDVEVNGKVLGDVRGAAQSVTIAGEVGKNALLFAQSAYVEEKGAVTGELLAYAQDVKVAGAVQRNMEGAAQKVVIDGTVGGNVAYEVDQLVINPGAKIDGQLEYKAPKQGQIADGTVAGPVEYNVLKETQMENEPVFSGFGWALSLVTTLLLWLLFRFVFKKGTMSIKEELDFAPFKEAGIGALVLIFTPIVSILLLFTVVGIPISFLAMIMYAVLWYISKVFVGIWLGYKMTERAGRKLHPMVKELIGVVLLFALIQVPYIGWVFGIVTVLLFYGALALALIGKRPVRPASAPAS